MKICPNCGRENSDINRFCAGCGTRFAEETGRPAVIDLKPEDEETMPDTGYDLSSLENEETVFIDVPAPESAAPAPEPDDQSYYDLEALENEETMALTTGRTGRDAETSDVPDFSYKGNVPVYKEGEGIKNPQPANNTAIHSAFKPVRDDVPQRPQPVQPQNVQPQPVPPQNAQPQYQPHPVPPQNVQAQYQPSRPVTPQNAQPQRPQPVPPQNAQPQRPQQAVPTAAEEAAYMNARQKPYQPVPEGNYGQKKTRAHSGHPGAASSSLDGMIEKLPGGKTGGCFFLRLTAAAVIILALVMYAMVQKAASFLSDIWNISEGPDLNGISSLANFAVICYWGALALGILALLELFGKNRKAAKNIFTDPRLWMTAVMLVLTVMSYDSLKAAMMSLDVINGDLSLDMLGDALSIGSNYRQTKTVIILNAVVAIAALVLDFVKHGSSVRTKAGHGAAAAGKAPYRSAPSARPQPMPAAPAPYAAPAPQAADASAEPEYIAQIRGLKQLLDDGIITEEEYENKKKVLLGL